MMSQFYFYFFISAANTDAHVLLLCQPLDNIFDNYEMENEKFHDDEKQWIQKKFIWITDKQKPSKNRTHTVQTFSRTW